MWLGSRRAECKVEEESEKGRGKGEGEEKVGMVDAEKLVRGEGYYYSNM